MAAVPDQQSWGLYIGPNSRALVLLHKHRGRIDLHLATLLALDGAFRQSQELINTTARLFEPFGSQNRVPGLFGTDFEPLKVHSGLTNAVVAEYRNVSTDGREDYRRYFGVHLPRFFLSNASDNLCYLTPQEAQRQRDPKHPPMPESLELRDLPQWTLLGGSFGKDDRDILHKHRSSVQAAELDLGPGGAFLQLLGLDDVAGGGSLWPFFGCAEVAKAGSDQPLVKAEQSPPAVQARDGPIFVASGNGPGRYGGYGSSLGSSGGNWYGSYGGGGGGSGDGARAGHPAPFAGVAHSLGTPGAPGPAAPPPPSASRVVH
jgi:hypothetical protein